MDDHADEELIVEQLRTKKRLWRCKARRNEPYPPARGARDVVELLLVAPYTVVAD